MIRYIVTRVAFVLFLLISALPVSAQKIASPSSGKIQADKIKDIEAAISAEMSRYNIPGLSVALVTNQKLGWEYGYGLADLENSVPVKTGTVFRLASISKPITATAVMQLVERGRINLDASVQNYCASFPLKPWPITVRQLLGHLGGIRHYKTPSESANTRHFKTLAEASDLFKDDPLLHEPGTKYFYTTYGFNLLGCAIEGASGLRYADYMRDNIFRPAGMDRMRVDEAHQIIPNRARGYLKLKSGEILNAPLFDNSSKIPGGGLTSTVEDIAKFAIAIMSNVLVKKVTVEQMWSRQRTRGGEETPYGLGWYSAERNGHREVWHGGHQQGLGAMLYMRPDTGIAVVLVSNLNVDGINISHELRRLAQKIIDITVQ